MARVIVAAVTPVVAVCAHNLYQGEALEYCTYNYSEIPAGFGDDRAIAMRCLVQVHYFCPLEHPARAVVRDLRRALEAADFTSPSVEDAGDDTCQHYVLECEGIDGG